MMVWGRSRRTQVCGRCGEPIGIGDPVLVISIDQVTKVRCQHCVQPPPDLPENIETTPPLPVRIARLLPLDFRARAAGEREPGEEG